MQNLLVNSFHVSVSCSSVFDPGITAGVFDIIIDCECVRFAWSHTIISYTSQIYYDKSLQLLSVRKQELGCGVSCIFTRVFSTGLINASTLIFAMFIR